MVKQPVNIRLSKDLRESIDDYAGEQKSNAEAHRELLRKGYRADQINALAIADGGLPPRFLNFSLVALGVSGLSAIFAYMLAIAVAPKMMDWFYVFTLFSLIFATVYLGDVNITNISRWMHRRRSA